MATNKENAIKAIHAKKANPVLLYFKRNTGIIIGLVLLTALFTIFTDNFLTISNGALRRARRRSKAQRSRTEGERPSGIRFPVCRAKYSTARRLTLRAIFIIGIKAILRWRKVLESTRSVFLFRGLAYFLTVRAE